MNEIQYKDIFKNPETIQNLKGKNVSSRERMLGNERLTQILQRSAVLVKQLAKDEAPYKAELEKLAVDMVKKMYPVIDEFDIEIEATLGEDQLSSEPEEPEESEEEEEEPIDIMNDDVAKRRLINAITQGASIRGALDKPFMDFLDEVPENLLDSYSETLGGIENSVDKYGETLKKVFGIFYDEEALAMFLAMLAGGNAGGGESKGGESEAKFDEEEGKLKIRATGIIFPFLIHEIIKGLYEIVSLQGFTKSKKINQAIADTADKLEHEPEDFGFGTHIQEVLLKLYNDANIRNKVAFELFLANLYRESNAREFIEFIEDLINNKLTSSQKSWVLNYMEPTPDKEDDEDISLSDLGLEENKKPYKDIKVTDKYIIREFNKNIDPIELMWHRDNEKRIIEAVDKTDWKIQLDNQLPKSLNEQISIPKHKWHRVIKGTGTLKLKIYKK